MAASPMMGGGFMMPPMGFGVPQDPTATAPERPPTKDEMPLASLLPGATDKTMLMFRNVTTSMTRGELIECLNNKFKGHYDFLYLPGDDTGEGNRGFGFLNFKTVEKAEEFSEAFNTKAPKDCFGKGDDDAKPCEVIPARIPNIDKNIERLRQNVAKNKDDKDRSAWYPTFINDAGVAKQFPMPRAGSGNADEKKKKADAKAKAKSDAKGKGGNGAPGPPPAPPMLNYPGYGYPGYGYPYANPYAMQQQYAAAANPYAMQSQYAVAMQQWSYQQQLLAQAHHQQMSRGLVDSLADGVSHSQRRNFSDEEKTNLKKQIEFYFSVDNLCKDVYLRSNMNADGWIPLELIKQFPRVRKFKASEKNMMDVLKSSEIVELDASTRTIRLQDEALRAKWAQVSGEFQQSLTPKSGEKAAASTS
jgi:hypothetical protein